MPLIVTHRHRPEDLEHWRRVLEPVDAVTARRLARRLAERAEAAKAVIAGFLAKPGGGYLGVSWGKDSVVVAHMLHELERSGAPSCPAVWVRVSGWENPDCPLVREAFLARWPLQDYHEIEVEAGDNRAGGTSARGFEVARRRWGRRHISGVRGEESSVRGIVAARYGTASSGSCRPIVRWSSAEVFSYCHLHGLPLHPAYGYTAGGTWDRAHLRTGSLGGERGAGHGRREWERSYYPEWYATADHKPQAVPRNHDDFPDG